MALAGPRAVVLLAAAFLINAPGAAAQTSPLVDRNGSIVAVEGYGPNIVRITIATDRALAAAGPGPGITGQADQASWTHDISS